MIKNLDFNNTEVAFRIKNDRQLGKMRWLYNMMNKPWLVNIGSKLGLAAIKVHLPGAETVLKSTIFEQFCGGETLLDCQPNIEALASMNVLTILDYGAEGKEDETDFNFTMNNTLRAIDFAHQNPNIPVVSTKITGLARFALLEKVHNEEPLNDSEDEEWNNVIKRIEAICYNGSQKDIQIYIDAEETWIQKAVDNLANKMMSLFNQQKAIVFNTFQMYRTDTLEMIRQSHQLARSGNYLLGAKLVRGAYMEKERERAAKLGYPSPIQPNKAGTDTNFDDGIKYCVENIEEISICCASHNMRSNYNFAQLLEDHQVRHNHPHVMFSQLFGMSDNLTFNLANAGFRSSKYMPYGPVRDVIPYLIRRAEENTAVSGDMSREYKVIDSEYQRRKKSR